ncbi:MAG: sugar ABC transporter substrate-binding protein [Anaerolineae bacterium]|nr:sugar ABC transporter substrate-binding protein [Anaerolineae bacterium]
MGRKTFFLVLSFVLLLTLSFSMAAAQDAPLRIGLVQLGTDNPFWIAQVAGGQEAARRNGFELVVTSGEGDVTKQVQAFEDLVNQGVSAISINPLDANAFGPAMEQAAVANIPVVCLFSQMDGCVTVLGFEERVNGGLVAQYAVKLLTDKYGEPKGNVAILLGALGQDINTNRAGGFTDVLANYPNITVVAAESTGNWEADKAVALTENWLTAYPDLDLIYGLSDSLTVPASDVLKRAGREDIMLVSYDGTEVGLAGVADGSLRSTVALLPQYNGFWNVYAAYLVATGVQFPATYYMPGAMVTTENLAGFQQLSVDLAENITKFPFELPVGNIVADYAARAGS